MRRPIVGSKARAAAKSKERGLVTRAKRLREGPDPILPECRAECRRCPFERVRAKLLKLLRYKDDKKKLASIANIGSGLTKAYAATLLLAAQEKAPYLAAARIANRDIAYAQRGRAKKELLIGFQHYDDPDARLLAVADIARRNGLFIYSTREKMICAGTSGKPPREYVTEAISRMKYPFQKSENGYLCIQPGDETTLELIWIPAGTSVRVSRLRASTKRNMASVVLNRMLYPAHAKVVEVNIRPGFKHEDGGEGCPLNSVTLVSKRTKEKYLRGEISDRELIDAHLESVKENARKKEERIFVVGMRCFGSDQDSFIESLRPSGVERKALEAALSSVEESIILDEASPSKVLDMFWEKAGRQALHAVVGDEERAEKLFKESMESERRPSDILREAHGSVKKERILSALPRYKRLSPVARFCDGIARVYRTEGPGAAAMEIRRDKSREKVFKALEYAFLLALDQGRGEEWRYTKDEREFGAHLAPAARALLAAKPEDYDDSLRKLLAASGHAA